jgi:hypothetical protein
MAAEGLVKYDVKSASRSIHLKMMDKEEIDYILSLLKNLRIKTGLSYSKSDNGWVIIVSVVYELEKLHKLDIFKLTKIKKSKFDNLISGYKRKQTKKEI